MRYIIAINNRSKFLRRTRLGIEWVYDMYEAETFRNIEEAQYWLFYVNKNCTGIENAESIKVELKEVTE